MTDDIAVPDGVSEDDVRIESEVLGYVDPGILGEYERPFNPQNGRLYEERDPGCADYDAVEVSGGLEVNCAYEDCGGFRDFMVYGEVNRSCPECGEPKMGRAQFSEGSKKHRSNRNTIAARTDELRDEFASEMKRLTEAGVGPVAATDYLMCSVGETGTREWAKARGVQERTVRRHMKEVANALGETVKYNR